MSDALDEGPEGESGQIITFYSYKGGVGRSMALANVAALLAIAGRRVLVVDWDLEAPGIERYFLRYLQGDRATTDGLVEIMQGFAGGRELRWEQCLIPVRIGDATLDILSAGRQDDGYARRLADLNWERLFAERDLGRRLEQLRDQWRTRYDFVLVDSRTGITDIGGICTIHLPDALIAMFTANEQSLGGVARTLRTARRSQAGLPVDRAKLLVVPVPARDESQSEHERAKEWRARFAKELAEFYGEWLPVGVRPVDALDVLRIPYKAYWSFGEPLPVIDDGVAAPGSIGFAYALLSRLIDGGFDWEAMSTGKLVGQPSLPRPADRPPPPYRPPPRWLPWSTIAAAALVLAGIGLFAFQLWPRPGPTSVDNAIKTLDRLTDEMCTCGDQTCVYWASKDLTEALHSLADDNFAVPSEAQRTALDAIEKRIVTCGERFTAVTSPSGCEAAWNAGDRASLESCYAADAADSSSVFVDSQRPVSFGAIDIASATLALREGLPDARLTPQLALRDGRKTATVLLFTGTNTEPFRARSPTGASVGMLVLRLSSRDKHGRIVYESWVMDEATLAAQVRAPLVGSLPLRPAVDHGFAGAPMVVVSDGGKVEQDNLATAARWGESLATLDVGPLLAAWADDGVESDQAAPNDFVGKPVISLATKAFVGAFPRGEAAWIERWAAGDYVVSLWHFEGRHERNLGPLKRTGRRVSITIAEIAHLQDGKIDQLWRFWNNAALFQQLGLTKRT